MQKELCPIAQTARIQGVRIKDKVNKAFLTELQGKCKTIEFGDYRFPNGDALRVIKDTEDHIQACGLCGRST